MSSTPTIDNNITCLILACKEGYQDIAESLVINYEANVNGPDGNGITPLIIAIRYGHFKIVAFLIEKGANVNYECRYSYIMKTALTEASRYGHSKIAAFLIENGADVNATSEYGITALVNAIEHNNTEIAKLLIEKGAKINVTEYRMMNYACAWGNLEIVELLVAKGVDINYKRKCAYTPLMTASRYGRLEVVQFLIDKGANVNYACPNSISLYHSHMETALIGATENGHISVVKFLVEKGANVNLAMDDGMTALMWASISGRLEIFKFLVENGANINATTTSYLPFFWNTALTYARQFHKDSIINENRLKIVKFITDREKKTVTNNFWDCIKRNMPFSYIRIKEEKEKKEKKDE